MAEHPKTKLQNSISVTTFIFGSNSNSVLSMLKNSSQVARNAVLDLLKIFLMLFTVSMYLTWEHCNWLTIGNSGMLLKASLQIICSSTICIQGIFANSNWFRRYRGSKSLCQSCHRGMMEADAAPSVAAHGQSRHAAWRPYAGASSASQASTEG